jgi:Spy/CpxP family protein refolding chaperone
MIRSLGKMVVAFGALALLATPAWAQGRGFGMGMGGGAGILRAPNVQKELKLSDEQIGKIQDSLTASREKHADDYAALRDLSQEERPAKVAELNKTISSEVKKALSFNDTQSKRFDQIAIQASGLMAFADPTVASKLKLTSDQKSKIREIQESSRGQLQGFNFKDASEQERADFMKKMATNQKENMTKAMAVLTSEQKSDWKELTGDPVEINMPPFQRPNN